ncbi:lamin tail domain-containing protein [Gynurincola endophyticus]|uniref:lamin tail domain-containing protein n=1 Tax=Gynurincola endophyticus TaxID=2479004 RepID=UPI000F8C30B4|nr:lamin tail domain-containing protein [Gynurincola endophyticus]
MRILLISFVLLSYKPLFSQYRLYDLLITEFMADPTPVVSLPNAEFVEVYNNTNDTISLLNWQLADAATAALIRTNYRLPPNEYVILCGTNNVSSFSVYGPTIGITGFPNLNNDEDKILLIDPAGKTIHEIHYTLQ